MENNMRQRNVSQTVPLPYLNPDGSPKPLPKNKTGGVPSSPTSAGRPVARASSSGGVPWSKLLLAAIFLPLISQWLTGTYHFGVYPTVKPYLKAAYRASPFAPAMREFTLEELKQYDGSDPSKPVYVSVGGKVFDVSNGRRLYGKGGSYNMMAGRDASRSFITGCFETHLTHDLRGLDKAQLDSLTNWENFFANSDKYERVGTAILPPIDPKSPIPAPCHDAQGKSEARHGKKAAQQQQAAKPPPGAKIHTGRAEAGGHAGKRAKAHSS